MRIRSTLIILSVVLLAGVMVGCEKEEPEDKEENQIFKVGSKYVYESVSESEGYGTVDTVYASIDSTIDTLGKIYSVMNMDKINIGIKYTRYYSVKGDSIFELSKYGECLKWILNQTVGETRPLIIDQLNGTDDTIGTIKVLDNSLSYKIENSNLNFTCTWFRTELNDPKAMYRTRDAYISREFGVLREEEYNAFGGNTLRLIRYSKEGGL
jgi:hypothetical protein